MEEIIERPEFERNIKYVEKYLIGIGLDMGCGRCPLLKDNCYHIDISPQPLAVEQVGIDYFIKADAVNYVHSCFVDYIFSCHMIEDLENTEAIINCLNKWSINNLKVGGKTILLLPDMQGGRYPKVEEEGNISHKTNVGVPFILEIQSKLSNLHLIQIDNIPHETTCTLDVVFERMQ